MARIDNTWAARSGVGRFLKARSFSELRAQNQWKRAWKTENSMLHGALANMVTLGNYSKQYYDLSLKCMNYLRRANKESGKLGYLQNKMYGNTASPPFMVAKHRDVGEALKIINKMSQLLRLMISEKNVLYSELIEEMRLDEKQKYSYLGMATRKQTPTLMTRRLR